MSKYVDEVIYQQNWSALHNNIFCALGWEESPLIMRNYFWIVNYLGTTIPWHHHTLAPSYLDTTVLIRQALVTRWCSEYICLMCCYIIFIMKTFLNVFSNIPNVKCRCCKDSLNNIESSYNHEQDLNSSFHVIWGTMGKVQYLFFRSFLLVLKQISFW